MSHPHPIGINNSGAPSPNPSIIEKNGKVVFVSHVKNHRVVISEDGPNPFRPKSVLPFELGPGEEKGPLNIVDHRGIFKYKVTVLKGPNTSPYDNDDSGKTGEIIINDDN